MATTFTQIASVTVGSGGAANIEFTSIPSTYTDLMVYYSLRLSSNDSFGRINLNGTTTTKIRVYGDGSGTGSDTNAVVDFRIDPDNATANTFGSGSLYIPNYTSSSYKSYSIDTVYENNATTAVAQLLGGLWSDTAVVNAIKFLPQSGNFVQYSTATLYGINNS
jgi:hypothetical protein